MLSHWTLVIDLYYFIRASIGRGKNFHSFSIHKYQLDTQKYSSKPTFHLKRLNKVKQAWMYASGAMTPRVSFWKGYRVQICYIPELLVLMSLFENSYTLQVRKTMRIKISICTLFSLGNRICIDVTVPATLVKTSPTPMNAYCGICQRTLTFAAL